MELERGTGVDGARKRDEVCMKLKQVKRVDVTQTRDKGECGLNE